jgi:4'-phosphopantetheinyl transferase
VHRSAAVGQESIDWSDAAEREPLLPGTVRVLAVPLLRAVTPEDRALLSADERARADRFHFARDSRRYVVTRATLRRVLGAQLGRHPSSLAFDVGPRGKPSLAGTPLHFNVAHAGELALIALTTLGEVGVDVEPLEPMDDVETIAERFFSPAEREALRALPAAARTDAFLTCWTRKEAYVKAIGEGLACPLDAFDVTLAPGEEARLLRIAGDDADRWSLVDLRPAPGYVGAVAGRFAMAHVDRRRVR